MAQMFGPGERVFTHYVMQWGTVVDVHHVEPEARHGVTGSRLPESTWYTVLLDNGKTELLDDASGHWDLARIVPPGVAERYGYGRDPQEQAA